MFETLCQPETLISAWKQVHRNGAATGGDGETSHEFSRNLDARIRRLRTELLSGQYRPGPLRKVPMKKPDGKLRLLRIPGIADRVVQGACQKLLSHRLDARMSSASFGYRPARSVAQALDRARTIASRNPWALDADILSFFDEVRHDRLLDEIGIWVDDSRVLALVEVWLRAFGGRKGLAQGAPISPFLANIFLHPLDLTFRRRGYPHVRYADDFVVFARSKNRAKAAMQTARECLRRRGLKLNEAKTMVVPVSVGFRFLGAEISRENKALGRDSCSR